MKEEVNEKEKLIAGLNNELNTSQNEINILIQKSQILQKEAKSESLLIL